MTWDLTGSRERRIAGRLEALKSKDIAVVAHNLHEIRCEIQALKDRESLTRVGWAKLDRIDKILAEMLSK